MNTPCRVSLLLLVLSIGLFDPSWAQPTPFHDDFFMQDGDSIQVEIDEGFVAIRLSDAVSSADSFLAAHVLLDADSVLVFPTERLHIVRLESASLPDFGSTLTTLLDDPMINFAGIVVRLNRNGRRLTRVLTEEIHVRLKENLSAQDRLDLYDRHGPSGLEEIRQSPINKQRVVLRPRPGGDFVTDAFVTLAALNAANALALQETTFVEYAQPNFIQKTVSYLLPPPDGGVTIPEACTADGVGSCGVDDSGAQWHLDHPPTMPGTPDADIDAYEAWCITDGSLRRPIIAVVDGGIEAAHLDLVGHVLPFNGVDRDLVDPDTDPSSGSDDSHGTQVSGVAAAVGNNTLDVAGVCPACQLLPIRARGGAVPVEDLGIDNAVVEGAQVIVLSWAFDEFDPLPTAFTDAIADAVAHNVVIAAAVPNSGVDIDELQHLSTLPNVIAVGSSSNDDTGLNSGQGDSLDLVAPGESILTTREGGGSQIGDGTSLAAPIVAGVAGLVLDLNPNLTPQQVHTILTRSAEKIQEGAVSYDPTPPGHSTINGYGRVNAYNALRATPPEACVSGQPYCIANVQMNGTIIANTWDPGDPLTISGQLLHQPPLGDCLTPVANAESLVVRLNPLALSSPLSGQHKLCDGQTRIEFHPGTNAAGEFSFTIRGGGPSWLNGDGVANLASYFELAFEDETDAVIVSVHAGNRSNYPVLSNGDNSDWIYGVLASPDLNGDGIVGDIDLAAFEALMGQPVTRQSGWQADFTHDGWVDASDLAYFAGRYGASCGAGPDFAMNVFNLLNSSIIRLTKRCSVSIEDILDVWEEQGWSFDRQVLGRIVSER